MLRLLLIGDSHIPRRAREITSEIWEKLLHITNKNPFEYTFFTGDLIIAPKFMNFLNNITKNQVFKVIGNMDYYGGNRNLPASRHLTISLSNDISISLGLLHGHQVHPRGDHDQLEAIALDNNFNLLVSGHTHKEEVFLTKSGILLLNPGSITGAWSFIASGNCSFIVLSIEKESKVIVVELYQFNKKNANLFSTKSSFQLFNNTIQKI
ncbi:MAG: YfcE family phosphodiesterase [Candidatus Thorarchaeota archaeon]